MTVELIIAPEAQLDVEDAYDWYEDHKFGLGEEFLSCVDAAVQSLCRSPKLYPKIFKDYRRALVRRFPYAIFYEYTDQKFLTIYSFFHTSQEPNKWRKRRKKK
ncbi:MAG: type II toxin-antitoxin system RelE/ParE family toxin [Desulfobulbaceae bacterium]|jgi:plasmid stabilization system protein ParE|nr:type II toxin-antitoxin system RelE/ParE family toxin [Desulfobulbaceae bacterium]